MTTWIFRLSEKTKKYEQQQPIQGFLSRKTKTAKGLKHSKSSKKNSSSGLTFKGTADSYALGNRRIRRVLSPHLVIMLVELNEGIMDLFFLSN